jgi:hypothetical protein
MSNVKRVLSQLATKPHDAAPDNTGRKKAPPFKPGESGNPAGRPKGARNKLGEDFLEAVYQDFQTHGPAVIEKVRQEKPAEYLRVVASLLPQVMQIDSDKPAREMSDAELMAVIHRSASECGLVVTEAEDDPPHSKH